MLVRDVMSSHVKTVEPDTPLTEVVALMCLYRYSGLPVVDNDHLVGFIAEKDVLHRCFPKLEDLMDGWASIDLDAMLNQYKDVVKLRVRDVMTRNPLPVSADSVGIGSRIDAMVYPLSLSRQKFMHHVVPVFAVGIRSEHQ